MFTRIKKVRHAGDYRIHLIFSNGMEATLDLKNKIVGKGGVFKPLEDVEYFNRVQVDLEIGTIVWPNGVDFCPDVLFSEATGEPLPVPEKASSR